jgi:quaternary ammonium compound-resistance protein SugE
MNAWVALVLAGVFEIGFTSFLKLSEDFTKWLYTELFLVSVALDFP